MTENKPPSSGSLMVMDNVGLDNDAVEDELEESVAKKCAQVACNIVNKLAKSSRPGSLLSHISIAEASENLLNPKAKTEKEVQANRLLLRRVVNMVCKQSAKGFDIALINQRRHGYLHLDGEHTILALRKTCIVACRKVLNKHSLYRPTVKEALPDDIQLADAAVSKAVGIFQEVLNELTANQKVVTREKLWTPPRQA